MDIEEIGKTLKFRREFLHLSQQDLAQMSEVNNRTVHVVEAGTGNPSLETIVKLAEILGLEIVVQVKKKD
jgi:predicted transcriptional regulator